jgi:hypothetical protein
MREQRHGEEGEPSMKGRRPGPCLGTTAALLLLLCRPAVGFHTAFDYPVDQIAIDGQPFGPQVGTVDLIDDFDDGVTSPFGAFAGTISETGGQLHLKSPGTHIGASDVSIAFRSTDFAVNGGGNVCSTVRWPSGPVAMNSFVIAGFGNGFTGEGILIGLVRTDAPTAAVAGIPPGLAILRYRFELGELAAVAIDDTDVTGDVLSRVCLDDAANVATVSISLDGGSTFLSPILPTPTFVLGVLTEGMAAGTINVSTTTSSTASTSTSTTSSSTASTTASTTATTTSTTSSTTSSSTTTSTASTTTSTTLAGPSKCTSKELSAAGKKALAKAKCHSKAVSKGDATALASCLAAAESKFTAAYGKATAAGDCINATDAATVEGEVDGFIGDLDTTLVNGSTAASKCTGKAWTAAGKKAAARLKCHAKAVAKGDATALAGCLATADAKFTAAYGKATMAADCINATDAPTVEGKVDAFTDDLRATLAP